MTDRKVRHELGKHVEVDEAVTVHARKVFWERTNAGYAGLREDREGWARISDERDGESGALRDASG